jgi:hypothetical protein
MKARTARDVNLAFAVVLGILFLANLVMGAVLYAPDYGYTPPSYLAWIQNLSLSDWLYLDSLLSILVVGWVVFSYVERGKLGERRRSNRGSATGEAIIILLVVVLAIVLLAELGLNFRGVVSLITHFFGGS